MMIGLFPASGRFESVVVICVFFRLDEEICWGGARKSKCERWGLRLDFVGRDGVWFDGEFAYGFFGEV